MNQESNRTNRFRLGTEYLLRPWGALRKHLSWKQAFLALRHPNYRLWFWSQMFSLFGSWMQSTALGFLVYDLTRSPAYLGVVGFAAGIPTWLFMLYAGVIADRVPKRRVIIITQVMMTLLAVVISGLAFLHVIRPWHIVILAFLLGTANAFEAPARQAFVLELVNIDDLTNAIALNSAMFNTATAIGPAVGGITYALFGPAWCFAINAVSFLPVIAALKMMKLGPAEAAVRSASPLEDIKAGLRYVAGAPVIRGLIGLVGVVTLFGMSFVNLLPAWAVKVLGGDARTNGFLQSARGIGALAAALIIASLGRFNFRGRLLTLGAFSLPLLLVAFSFVKWTPLSVLLLFGIGLCLIFVFNLGNALIQTAVPNQLRGRVMSVYTLTFFGLMPVGSIAIGSFAERFGEKTAVLSFALVALAGVTAIFSLVPRLKKQA
jgi:MFS family permease